MITGMRFWRICVASHGRRCSEVPTGKGVKPGTATAWLVRKMPSTGSTGPRVDRSTSSKSLKRDRASVMQASKDSSGALRSSVATAAKSASKLAAPV